MTAREAVAVLSAAYKQETLERPTEELYVRKLEDIQPSLLRATIEQIVERSRFFPSIAQIRETAADIAGILPPSAEEALGIIRQADVEEPVFTRDGEYRYTERHWHWPEMTDTARKAIDEVLAMLGDPVKNDKRVFGWDMDFKRVYEVKNEERKQKALADLSRVALPAPRPPELTDGSA